MTAICKSDALATSGQCTAEWSIMVQEAIGMIVWIALSACMAIVVVGTNSSKLDNLLESSKVLSKLC